MSIVLPDPPKTSINPEQIKDLKKKVIEDYLSTDSLSDVSASGSIANVNDSAKGKARIGQMKQLLDKARHIYWNLRYNDMQHMSEEFWEDQLMLLSGMSPSIKLINQYSVKDKTDNSGKAGIRFFDMVEIRSDKVRVFELKARSITTDDILSTINKGSMIGAYGTMRCKNYLEVMRDEWPSLKRSLIFTSPFGIDKNALKLVEDHEDIFYINYRELARVIYKDIINSYPCEAEWKYESIKGDKYRLIF